MGGGYRRDGTGKPRVFPNASGGIGKGSRMKKIGLLLIIMLFSGCWQYSEGTTVGYVTTVEGGVFWDSVFIRAEFESSNTDGYAIRKKENELKEKLLQSSRDRQRIEVRYLKHLGMMRACHTSCPSDEIVSFNVVK